MGKWFFVIILVCLNALEAMVFEADPFGKTWRFSASRGKSAVSLLSDADGLSSLDVRMVFALGEHQFSYGRDDNAITGRNRGWKWTWREWEAAVFTPLFDRSSPVYLSGGGAWGSLSGKLVFWYRPTHGGDADKPLLRSTGLSRETEGYGFVLRPEGLLGSTKLVLLQAHRSCRYIMIDHELKAGPVSFSLCLGDASWPLEIHGSWNMESAHATATAGYHGKWGRKPLFGGEARSYQQLLSLMAVWSFPSGRLKLSVHNDARYSSASRLVSSSTYGGTLQWSWFSLQGNCMIMRRPAISLGEWTLVIGVCGVSAAFSGKAFVMRLAIHARQWDFVIMKEWGKPVGVTISFTTNPENAPRTEAQYRSSP